VQYILSFAPLPIGKLKSACDRIIVTNNLIDLIHPINLASLQSRIEEETALSIGIKDDARVKRQ